MKTTLCILGAILSVFSFLPLIKTTAWWIRVLDFPRAHVAIILSAVLITYLALYGLPTASAVEITMLVIWALAILNEVRYIYHFTPLARREALRAQKQAPDNTLKFMISNVRMTNKHYRKFLELVLQEQPDMLVINEPNEKWHQELRPVLDKEYPYSIKKPLENTYGMLFYSRFKLHDTEVRFLVEDGIPSMYAVVELPGGAKFDLFLVHPQPPRFLKDTETREAELLIAAKMSKKTPYPSIVAGDLNDVAWSRTTKLFKHISGLIDPRVGRGFYNTYNAFVPLFRYPLDHVFYDPVFRLAELRRLSKFGSDHFPIAITLSYEPQHEQAQYHPKPVQEDKQEAQELIEEGLEKGEENNEEKKSSKA
ncbi:endonuclease/exonuclease/phosphatase family protein [Pontibacter sp. SGAir0037]|uniref:endonuclease/exonuclease/phosphatase family protein n=1 Tax=Pontibacter sp. SGAir0037 TaxID=2571030 RepID=UPI0010CCC231|nr:endonuclease/exonuclease/phosphatase family protein [Pontibacter sp. SGAir0037]QCR24460.1 endonuclease/exonuclease/phosphatase [Pontibacter sp. SGAir0037]